MHHFEETKRDPNHVLEQNFPDHQRIVLGNHLGLHIQILMVAPKSLSPQLLQQTKAQLA